MRVILANQTNFDRPWAESGLGDLLMPKARVLIIPIDVEDQRISDDCREDLCRPLLHYGIGEERIAVRTVENVTETLLENSDIVVLAGGDPRYMGECLGDFALTEVLRNYPGILMGIAGGAEILMDTYRGKAPNDYKIYEGLGLVPGVSLFIDYQQNAETIRMMIEDLEQNGRPLLVMPQNGAIILDQEHLDLLGDAFFADMSDLDDLYQLLDSMMC